MSDTTDPSFEVKHRRYVETLAQEARRPVEDVDVIYTKVMADLEGSAHVKDFVPIFAWREVRSRLRQGPAR